MQVPPCSVAPLHRLAPNPSRRSASPQCLGSNDVVYPLNGMKKINVDGGLCKERALGSEMKRER